MLKIISLSSALPMDGSSWTVGNKALINEEWKEITEIKDMGAEFETGIYERYDIYVEGKLHQSLVNVPVIVTYDTQQKMTS